MQTLRENHTDMPRHVTFWPRGLDRTAGGPSGYLWHLDHGIRQLTGRGLDVVGAGEPASAPASGKVAHRTSLARSAFARMLATRLGATAFAREALLLARSAPSSVPMPGRADFIDDPTLASVHCHSTTDLLGVHNALVRAGRRDGVRLVLTSHAPEMPGLETASALAAAGGSKAMALAVGKGLVRLDTAAFLTADSLVFPCEEATEPYEAGWDGFRAAARGRHVAYVPTGVDHVPPDERQPGGRTTRIGFVGRHNSVKGYDLLRDAMAIPLGEGLIEVVCAGTPGPVPAPRRKGWTELGRIPGPNALFARVDAVALPNRQTYFDILALECMAAGLPLLASSTGGNRYLAKVSRGVITYEPTPEGLERAVRAFTTLDNDQREALGSANREAYLSGFTAMGFARRYLDAITSMCRDAIPAH